MRVRILLAAMLAAACGGDDTTMGGDPPPAPAPGVTDRQAALIATHTIADIGYIIQPGSNPENVIGGEAAWLIWRQSPSPEEIFDDPGEFPLPETIDAGSACWAYSGTWEMHAWRDIAGPAGGDTIVVAADLSDADGGLIPAGESASGCTLESGSRTVTIATAEPGTSRCAQGDTPARDALCGTVTYRYSYADGRDGNDGAAMTLDAAFYGAVRIEAEGGAVDCPVDVTLTGTHPRADWEGITVAGLPDMTMSGTICGHTFEQETIP